MNSEIRNIGVISVFHCGGRTLLGWDTVIASDQIRSGQVIQRNDDKGVRVSS